MSFQPALLKTLGYLLAWGLVLATPVLAWGLAALLVGPGPNSRWRRAAIPVGKAVLVTLGLVVAARLLEATSRSLKEGPLGWLKALEASLSSGASSVTWYPVDAVLLLALLHAGAFFLVVAVAALRERSLQGTPFRVPLADVAALVLLAVPVLALVAVDGAWRQDRPGRMLLDVAAVLPMLCVALAVWTRAERLPPPQPAVAPQAQTPALPRVDVPALWRGAGALEANARPLLTSAAAAGSESAPAWSAAAWREAGAEGPPPRALEEIASAWGSPGQGWLVGDLPDPTERYFLTACTLLALQREGLPCLVISDEPEALRDAVAEAIARGGAWPSGPLLAGEAELREAFAGSRLPAAVFLDIAQLSSGGIRALAEAQGSRGRLWARGVGLVLLSRVDRGTPLASTHRLFTLRRLELALSAAGARWSVLATGVGGVGTRGLVEQMFPGISVREVPFAPRVAAPVRVWRVAEGFRAQPGTPWVRRALEPVVAAKVPVAVGDPGGAFDLKAADFWGGEVRFVRDVSLFGVASVGTLDEAWLVAAYRALGHRVPLAQGQAHEALWALSENPVTRFLTRDGNLDGLSRHGMLMPPRPLVGYHNGALATAHLKAALQDGAQDVESLAAVFGRSRVEQVLGPRFRPERYVVRLAPGRETVRSPLVPASLAEAANPLRRTVSEQVVRILDVHSGQLLTEVDRLVVETRYYPGRVFAVGDARYEVPLNSYDAKRGEIRVKPVPNDRPLTRPQLHIQFESATVVESPQTVRTGRCVYQVSTLEATVVETVTGYSQVGRPGRVDVGAVSCRYRTRVRGIFFPAAVTPNVLFHLARSADGVLIAHLLSGDEDMDVVPVGQGLFSGAPAGIVVVDRYLQGMGVAEALDLALIDDTLKWVRALLANCRCSQGCAECTPQEVLGFGPDKSGVLGLLG
jgi:hypothetical protein